MTLFLILVLISLFLLISEYLIVRRAVNKIPIRILVNGTRGKSSVVKYISAGLRGADKRTLAKITGVIPTIINPDGSEKIIKRIGPVRIQEQFKLIKLAAKNSIECLVLECMSINPELQMLESKIFRPDIYVITNIRDDHREQMGDTENQIHSICEAIPVNSCILTAEKKYLSEIKQATESKNSKLIFVDENELVNNEYESTFSANIKIAQKVFDILKIENAKSEAGLQKILKSDINSFLELRLDGKKVTFINGFAVNDVQSAEEFLDHWDKILSGINNLNIIFNSRSDRPLRSVLFAKWISSIKILNKVILTGNHIPRTKLELTRNGIDPQRIIVWTRKKTKNLRECVKEIAEHESFFMGFGNIAGDGLRIVNIFESLSLGKNTL